MGKVFTIFIVVVLCCLSAISHAQGVDSLFVKAREYAFSGERDRARELLNQILVTSPEYSDVRILLGRTYSWDGKRNNARTEFYKVFAYDSLNAEAWSALADVELWDDKPDAALAAMETALRLIPGNKELMIKKTKALINLKRCGDVTGEINKIKRIDSTCAECKALEESAFRVCANKTIGVGTNFDFFSRTYGLAVYNYIQLGYKKPKNSFIFRLNHSSRFDTTGFQPEIDMYPSLGKKMYGYFNYGFTPFSLFPRHRLGIEVYRSLPKSFEASIGGRYMNFVSSEVFIYTASLTKYKGNFAFIGRVYITPDTKSFSRSGMINIRRYYSDADSYIGITFSAGASPDQRSFLTTTGLDSAGSAKDRSLYFFKSQRVGFTASKTFNNKHIISLSLDYTNQELEFSRTEYVNVFGASITYRLRYK